MMLNFKLNDTYITSRLNKEIFVPNFIEPYVSAKFLPYLEFHIADHCNLNCHACGHCSSLVKEPVFPVLKKFTKDFEQLNKFIDDIGIIRIMGGEPLLNTEINEYIKLNRRLYPFADIRVVTNAILLPQMPEDFFETLRTCNVAVDITFYHPMQSKMPDIKNLLYKKDVKFNISSTPKDVFFQRGLLKPHNHLRKTFFLECEYYCTFLYDGKIAACTRPFTNKYFNGYLDLYDESITTEKIIHHLLTPMKLCGYCGDKKTIKWRPIKHPVKLSDWVTDVADS